MENPSSSLSRHQFKSKKAMEKTNDRISQLPDAVLHYILSMMPMKFIVRTSILSRRWRKLWKDIWAYATALDFGAELATGQSPKEFVSTVNRYLQLHKGKEIQMFRLSLIPCNLSYAEKWVKFAVAKGAKELDLDFRRNSYDDVFKFVTRKLLNSIFSCDSITHLNLSCCYFHPRLNFKGCPYLKTLHLSMVRVTDALFESMLSNCRLLEELDLRDCHGLTRVKVSAPDLPLKSLTLVDCWDAGEIEIFAPNLHSFHFYGSFIRMYFKNISSLVDVLLNCMFREGLVSEDQWMTVLHQLEHVKILTLCYVSLEYVESAVEVAPEYLPVTFHNLQELQLLVKWYAGCFVFSPSGFFKNCQCPCLEKLFIELSSPAEYPPRGDYQCEGLPAEDTPGIVFDHLKVIKMNDFRGVADQMELVHFFLEKAIVLESLVLVVQQKGVCNMKKDSALESQSADAPLGLLREQLLILAKASSSDTQILICEYSDDDGALVPTHTEIYC